MPGLPSPIPEPVIKQFYLPDPATKEVDGQQVPIPQEEQGWVKMDVSPINTQDMLLLEATKTSGQNGLSVFVERIKAWNYEANGQVLPITIQTLLGLGIVNLTYLSSQMMPSNLGQTLSITQKKS
jgi:hypothetical protein